MAFTGIISKSLREYLQVKIIYPYICQPKNMNMNSKFSAKRASVFAPLTSHSDTLHSQSDTLASSLESETNLLKLICLQNGLRLSVGIDFIFAQRILLNSLKSN